MLSLRTAISSGLIALTIAGTTIATASQANAHDHDHFWPGLATGFVGGAIVGGALSQPRYYAPPAYYAPVYRPYYVGGGYPRCHVAWRQNRWGDQYRVRVCS
ncbi:hypothetical protein [Rhizobium sp. PL01]|uniref:hypothetical protein n=1 Tax=Rhizobium sp. PL01 TaxID=3085631 RepID=UPI002981ACE6|nr:hypothetical protein [Rhizobium sp. PL01]MDW5312748.1 hypothetical protein [Rhizobium sp. PL01]